MADPVTVAAVVAGGALAVQASGVNPLPQKTVRVRGQGLQIGGRRTSPTQRRDIFGLVGGTIPYQRVEPREGGSLQSQIEQAAREQYEALEDSARREGAARASEALNIEPPLTGDEDFEEAARKIGAAAGAAGAGAACVATGVGAVGVSACAYIGGLVGAYFGEEIGPWLDERWDDVEEFAADVWDEVSGWFSDIDIPFI